jgi:hypothetical protein
MSEPQPTSARIAGVILAVVGAVVVVAGVVVAIVTGGWRDPLASLEGIGAGAALVVGIILIVVGLVVRHQTRVRVTSGQDTATVVSAPVPAILSGQVEIPVVTDQLSPFVPPEQARGYGWLRASDLAKSSRERRGI